MSKKLIFVAVLSAFIYTDALYAYEVTTHEDLSEEAVLLSIVNTDPKTLSSLGLEPFANEQKFPNSKNTPASVRQLFRDGARFEDELNFTRPLNHFFDPKSGHGLAIPNARTSPDWALEDKGDVTDIAGEGQDFSYKEGRKYFLNALTKTTKDERNKNFGLTFQTLGMVIHHIQDMAQPQHVRNDDHCNSELCKVVFRHHPSLYESYTDEVLESLPRTDYAPVYSPTETLAFNSPRKFWIGEGKGMADFTNRNFVSARTNFRNNLTGILPSAEYAEPAPHQGMVFITPADAYAELGESFPPEIKEFCGKGDPCKIGFVQTTVNDAFREESVLNDRAASWSIFDEEIQRRGLEIDVSEGMQRYRTDRIFSLNRLNYRMAHEFLIPRAVGYSAGLINYFFRGKMDFIPDPDNAGKFVIKNLGPEEMQGSFTLYYDDKEGIRHATPNKWDLKIGANQFSNPLILKPNSVGSPEPEVAEEYMLVFNGVMGEEQPSASSPGAVVAKKVKDPLAIKVTNIEFVVSRANQYHAADSYILGFNFEHNEKFVAAMAAGRDQMTMIYNGVTIPCPDNIGHAGIFCTTDDRSYVQMQMDPVGDTSYYRNPYFAIWFMPDTDGLVTLMVGDTMLMQYRFVPQVIDDLAIGKFKDTFHFDTTKGKFEPWR